MELWKTLFCLLGPTCPQDYVLNVGEKDGKSCYAVVSETAESSSANSLQICQANDEYLRRPALPYNIDIVDELRKPPL